MTATTETVEHWQDRAITVDDILRSVRQVVDIRPVPSLVFTETALLPGSERNFPPSRHRSKRVEKKLLRRHGGFYRLVPAVVRIGATIYAHPSFRPELERRTRATVDQQMRNVIAGLPYR